MSGLQAWQAALAGMIEGADVDVIDACMVPGPSIAQGATQYRNGSLGVRAVALAEVYPVCRRLLGDCSFDGLAREFSRRSPSGNGDLNRYGEGFADWVGAVQASEPAFSGLPWLADLVRLEWLAHDLYYRADEQPFDLSPLETGDAGSLTVRPARHIDWLRSDWPVHRIWEAHQESGELEKLEIDRGDFCLLLERREFKAEPEIIDGPILALLEACRQGRTLAQIAADPALDADGLSTLVVRAWIGELRGNVDAV